MATIFCTQCNAMRAVNDWRERGDALVIELTPCGHLATRTARVEWDRRAAA
jgi:Zn ribbon nucleic-acid-binding protein